MTGKPENSEVIGLSLFNIQIWAVSFSCLTDERRPNDPPDALPALRRGGSIVDGGGRSNDRSDSNNYKV
jgi:hypothetical protein